MDPEECPQKHVFLYRLEQVEKDVHELQNNAKLHWVLENQPCLEEMSKSHQWVRQTERVVKWVVGAMLGMIMFWSAIWPFFKGKFEQ